MPGRLISPDVPFSRPAWSPWLDPLCWTTNALVLAAHLPVVTTARVEAPRWKRSARGPTLHFAWHRHNYALAIALRALPREERPMLLMHDGLASRALTHESATWLGFDVLVFHRRSPVSAREQIIAALRATGRDLLLLPDAGGPYGTVKPGLIEIGRACEAELRPCTVQVDGAWVVSRRLRHVLPRPFSRLKLIQGEALPAAEASPELCQRALEAIDPPVPSAAMSEATLR